VCNNPCIDATKTCPASVPFGTTSIPFSGVVNNCGNVPLTHVKVVDDNGTPGNTADDITIPLADIPVGGSVPYSGTHTVGADFCGPLTDTIVASADSVCGGSVSSPQRSCKTTINCQPKICVTKEIACLLPADECDTFDKIARGVKTAT